MLRLIALLAAIFLSLSVCAETRIKLVYSDLTFYLPDNISVMGDAGGKQNILIIRYGDVSGKEFVAFSDMTNDSSIDYGCSPSTFFRGVFSSEEVSGCKRENMEIVRQVFVEGKEVENWSVNDYEIKYSKGDKKTFAFIFGDEGKVVKIDSDFISKDSLEKMLRDL